ncbi:hypothetical protein TNIN_59821 [Trichonephila inaurata madagascariensis]|uniref:Uncharacterized protein n=1 Tax=Trichonephila inaurata madagascariensis TaxID=2747483 RepID=A0A8X6YDI6_9ARAC|nr:hypothetical protein TNIN_59821 [Trichonephila inaurata madagascariensis]
MFTLFPHVCSSTIQIVIKEKHGQFQSIAHLCILILAKVIKLQILTYCSSKQAARHVLGERALCRQIFKEVSTKYMSLWDGSGGPAQFLLFVWYFSVGHK